MYCQYQLNNDAFEYLINGIHYYYVSYFNEDKFRHIKNNDTIIVFSKVNEICGWLVEKA